ncbi:MAG: DNA-processing protein DprA [Limnochordia bacterium]
MGGSNQAAYALALKGIPGIGDRSVAVLMQIFPDPRGILDASESQMAALSPRLRRIVRELRPAQWQLLHDQASTVLDLHREAGFHPVARTDAGYPRLLRLVPDAPAILYVRGSVSALQEALTVTVVGTRQPTRLGVLRARRLAAALAERGMVVVSGLARGIDTAAHQGVLDVGGRTLAVLANPIDTVYPTENRALAERIISTGGALVSEHGAGQQLARHAFVLRDRIQSGLSVATIVVQTDTTGGTMHTVGFARRQGRLLLCLAPVADELEASQTAGVRQLLSAGRAQPFKEGDERALPERLAEHRQFLMKKVSLPHGMDDMQRARPSQTTLEGLFD